MSGTPTASSNSSSSSSSELPRKILLIGPSRGRKSALASFLCGKSDTISGSPGPTLGVRILEFEVEGEKAELWDVSGDQSYEATWPAIMNDADGILLILNPDNLGAPREALLWHEWFVSKPGIVEFDRVLCFSLVEPSSSTVDPGISLGPIAVERHRYEGDEDAIRKSFGRFITRLVSKR